MKSLKDCRPGDSLGFGIAVAFLWHQTDSPWLLFWALFAVAFAINAWKLWRINR